MTEGERLMCRMIEMFLDEHPEKEITVTLHCVGGEWRHKVEIKEKNIAKF